MSTVEDFQPQNWQASSTEALKISLIPAAEGAGALQFSPTFTYPIFGDEEQIYGFRDLVIHLVFDSVTFKPFLNVKYSATAGDDVDAQRDVIDKITPFLPEGDFIQRDEAAWVDAFMKERETFDINALGAERVDEYKGAADGTTYGVYRAPLGQLAAADAAAQATNPGAQSPLVRFWKRIQILTLLFIEAATYISLEDEPEWELYLTFNEADRTLVGLCTAYKYWDYRDAGAFDSSEAPAYRKKISQFLVLPPYQGQGHGSALYNAIYRGWFRDSAVTELTVEEPNEAFDDMRDRNDLEMLERAGFFAEVPAEPAHSGDRLLVSDEWAEQMRHKYKLEQRQFSRLLEMALLHLGREPYFAVQVKRRICIKNRDALAELADAEQRAKAVRDSFELVKSDYLRILAGCSFAVGK